MEKIFHVISKVMKIAVILVIFLCASCASKQKIAKTDAVSETKVDSTNVTKKDIRNVTDTTRTSKRSVKVTTIKFRDPEKNKKEHHPSAGIEETEDPEDEVRDDDDDTDWRSRIESIEITEFEDLTENKGYSSNEIVANDSSRTARNDASKSKITKEEEPKDPYTWRYIALLTIVIIGVLLFLHLRFRKK